MKKTSKYLENSKIVNKLLDNSFHYKENVIKVSKHETFSHSLAKFLICKELIDMDNRIITEAIFKDGMGRADILNITNLTVYEIVCTETEKSIEIKKNKYPKELSIVVLKAEDVIKQNAFI